MVTVKRVLIDVAEYEMVRQEMDSAYLRKADTATCIKPVPGDDQYCLIKQDDGLFHIRKGRWGSRTKRSRITEPFILGERYSFFAVDSDRNGYPELYIKTNLFGDEDDTAYFFDLSNPRRPPSDLWKKLSQPIEVPYDQDWIVDDGCFGRRNFLDPTFFISSDGTFLHIAQRSQWHIPQSWKISENYFHSEISGFPPPPLHYRLMEAERMISCGLNALHSKDKKADWVMLRSGLMMVRRSQESLKSISFETIDVRFEYQRAAIHIQSTPPASPTSIQISVDPKGLFNSHEFWIDDNGGIGEMVRLINFRSWDFHKRLNFVLEALRNYLEKKDTPSREDAAFNLVIPAIERYLRRVE